jgi:acetyl-CoA C-acetyltransferase
LMAPMTEVAERNPYAWFPRRRSVDELITATPENRMVGYPYTKYMVSIMDVDMAAAVIVATAEAADRLGVPDDQRVYLRGWSYATDPIYVAEHPEPWRSPAMEGASRAALGMAGCTPADIDHFDLYSCFASSVNLALDALGLKPGGEVTVTGGLPFSGGAGSDYMTHSIATMVDVLRRDGGTGLVSGVGMHLTKHIFAVYDTTPADGPVVPIAAVLETPPPMTIREAYAGPATVATYTVAHARDGSPEWGLAVCDVAPGERCYARIDDPGLLAEFESTERVGTAVTLATADNVNRVAP